MMFGLSHCDRHQAPDRQQIDRAGGRQHRIQGAHQVQDFTEAVSRSGVILIGDFLRRMMSLYFGDEYAYTI